MTDQPAADLLPAEKPAGKSTPKPTEPAPAAEPTVEAPAGFNPGDQVKHENGSKYTVRYQTPEGVANLVPPSVLRHL